MRFFLKKDEIQNNKCTITGEDITHIKDVMRLGPGDKITVCDGHCNDYLCQIDKLKKDYIYLNILEKTVNKAEAKLDLTLFQALTKGPKAEVIIQKTVELGVRQIIFLETDRSILKHKDGEKKLERWAKISKSAAMQSGRGIVPNISVAKFTQGLEMAGNISLSLMAHEVEKDTTIRNVIQNTKPNVSMALFIGPEGGFTKDEAANAAALGIHHVTLGPRILRLETAAIVTTAILLHEMGELGQ